MNISIPDTLALAFGLLFARTSGMLLALPQMLGVQVPVRVRLLLSLVLAGALMPMAQVAVPQVPGPLGVAMLVLRELVIGVTLAFASAIVIGAVLMAGDLIGNGMELYGGAILRGSLEVPNVLGDALGTLAGLLFFVAGLHRALLIALDRSLEVAPLGLIALPGLDDVLAAAGRLFALATELALPLMVPLFMLAVAQGVISRLAPQINILVAAPAAIVFAGLMLLWMDAFGLSFGITHAWTSVLSQSLAWIHG